MKQFVWLFTVIMLFLSGCSTQTSSNANIQFTFSNDYSASFITKEQSQLEAPKGICIYNEQILVCDYERSAIIVLDEDGNYLKQIGHLGSAPLEFINPTDIVEHDNLFYIIDSGNNRIQVLSPDFEHVKNISLPQYTQVQFCNIEIDKSGNIYVANNSTVGYDAILLLISPNGETINVRENFSGTFATKDELLVVESLEFSETKQSYILQSGMNSVFALKDHERLTSLFQLPEKYSPADMIVTSDNHYIFLSTRYCTIDQFSSEGIYEETLFKDDDYFHEFPNDLYMVSDGNGKYYINNPSSGGIIIIERQNSNE